MPKWGLSAGNSHATSPVIAGASRFHVIFNCCSGSRKQRAKREGALSVAYDVSYLYDRDNNKCVLRCRSAGQAPNEVFTCMHRAHRGADWVVGTELNLCGFDILVEEVMELHLIPYEENVASIATGAADGDKSELDAGGCIIISSCGPRPPPLSTTSSVQIPLSSVPLGTVGGYTAHAQPCALTRPSQAPLHAAAATMLWATHDDGRSSVMPFASEKTIPTDDLQAWPTLNRGSVTAGAVSSDNDTTDPPPPTYRDERSIDGYEESHFCLSFHHQQRRRRRSSAYLAQELVRCYPQYF
ncbi:hypothetical protein JKF63_05419 [Porcisia hertigi]|uniref:Uncharacterized protein n=1 Tax=Porcisia hertigi TaxID=2761500 RepID=A0A836IXY1_9TRYP|nr:hypothetical protein JKF63_05419 [Porcisia hertigi]